MTADEAAELQKFRENVKRADLPDFCDVAASCFDEILEALTEANAPRVTIEMGIAVAVQLRAWKRHLDRPTGQTGNA